MKRKMSIVMVFLCLAIITACPGQQSVKPYEAGKVTAEGILFNARVAQNSGLITADQFGEVKKVYDQLKEFQDLAIDARKAMIIYNTSEMANKYDTVMSDVIKLSMRLMDLSTKLKLIKGVQ